MFYTYEQYEGDNLLFLVRDRKSKELVAAIRFHTDGPSLIEVMDERSIFTVVQLQEIIDFVKEKQSGAF